jgi:hypothetical protein
MGIIVAILALMLVAVPVTTMAGSAKTPPADRVESSHAFTSANAPAGITIPECTPTPPPNAVGLRTLSASSSLSLRPVAWPTPGITPTLEYLSGPNMFEVAGERYTGFLYTLRTSAAPALILWTDTAAVTEVNGPMTWTVAGPALKLLPIGSESVRMFGVVYRGTHEGGAIRWQAGGVGGTITGARPTLPRALCAGAEREPNDTASTAVALYPGVPQDDSTNMQGDFVDVFRLVHSPGYTRTLSAIGAPGVYPVILLYRQDATGEWTKFASIGNGKLEAVWDDIAFDGDVMAEVYMTGDLAGCRDYNIQYREAPPQVWRLYLPFVFRGN